MPKWRVSWVQAHSKTNKHTFSRCWKDDANSFRKLSFATRYVRWSEVLSSMRPRSKFSQIQSSANDSSPSRSPCIHIMSIQDHWVANTIKLQQKMNADTSSYPWVYYIYICTYVWAVVTHLDDWKYLSHISRLGCASTAPSCNAKIHLVTLC